jgi:hypothetical protein
MAAQENRRRRPREDLGYSDLQRQAQSTNDRLRGQRQALGDKQRKRGDNFESTDAGFDWKTPIQIHGPDGTETV